MTTRGRNRADRYNIMAPVDWEFEIHHAMRDFIYDMHSLVTDATEGIQRHDIACRYDDLNKKSIHK